MPDNLFEGMFDLGTQGRGWRSAWAIGGLLLGAGIGGYLGWTGGGAVSALVGLGTGALIGWAAGVFLRGAFFFLLIFLVVLAGFLGWEWLTGG